MEHEVAVVTGASRGIGAATAIELGKLGYRVVVNYFSRADAANTVVEAVRAAGSEAIAVPGDMRDEHQAERVIASAVDTFGRLDALVCNAATPVSFTKYAELDFAALSAKINDELAASFHPVRFAVPALSADGGGRLVFVSTNLAHRFLPGALAHGTAKAALNAFAQYLAVELGPLGITSNVVEPSYVRTENSARNQHREAELAAATPLGRVGVPEDIGRVIARIASDTGGFMNGVIIPVTGGRDITA